MSVRVRIVELVGWYGVLAILAAFAMNSFAILSSQSFAYQLLNLTGALGIIISSLAKKDYQPVFLNIVWLIVAGIVLIKVVIGG